VRSCSTTPTNLLSRLAEVGCDWTHGPLTATCPTTTAGWVSDSSESLITTLPLQPCSSGQSGKQRGGATRRTFRCLTCTWRPGRLQLHRNEKRPARPAKPCAGRLETQDRVGLRPPVAKNG